MPNVHLETPRLTLRRLRADDLEMIAALNADAAVMRYIGTGAVRSREETRTGLQRSLRAPTIYPGLGMWLATEKPMDAFAGLFMLAYIPNTVEVEVGYRLARHAWGRGLATEGARALLAHGFDTLGLNRIVGVTHPENFPSQRVLQKIGLSDAGLATYYGRQLRYFVATRGNSTR